MAKMPETSGSDSPQRTDYKKTAGKADPTKKTGFVFDAKSKGKSLSSSSKNIFQMGRKAK